MSAYRKKNKDTNNAMPLTVKKEKKMCCLKERNGTPF